MLEKNEEKKLSSVLDIRIYANEQKTIEITFDLIKPKESKAQLPHNLFSLLHDEKGNVIKQYEDLKNYFSHVRFEKDFISNQGSYLCEEGYKKEYLTYQLPEENPTLLLWIGCLSIFLNNNGRNVANKNASGIEFVHVYTEKKSAIDFNHIIAQVDQTKFTSIEEYGSYNNFFSASLRKIIGELLTLKDTTLPYKKALGALEKIYERYVQYKDNNKAQPYLYFLQRENLFDVLYAPLLVPGEKRKDNLIELIKNSLADSHEVEANFILNRFISEVKKEFLAFYKKEKDSKKALHKTDGIFFRDDVYIIKKYKKNKYYKKCAF